MNLFKLSLLFLVILAAFLRFHNLDHLFIFTIDEEYIVDFAQTILKDFHIIWIGQSVSAGFYLGPAWIYLTAFLLFLSKGDPLILAYFSSLIGVVVTVLIFLIDKKLFNLSVAFFAALFYGTLPLFVFFDQRYWNDSLIPLLSLVMFFSLIQSFKDSRWWLLFAIAFGTIFHTHLSIFPYIFIVFYVLFLQRKKISKKILLSSFLIFIIIYSPLIVFDYVHNWDNLKLPFHFLSSSQKASVDSTPWDHAVVLFQTLGRFWYLKMGSLNVDEIHWGCTTFSKNGVLAAVDLTSTHTIPPFWLSFVSVLVFGIFFLKKSVWSNINTRILALSILLITVFYIVFPGGALEYYLLGIFPLIVFIPPLLAQNFPKRFKQVFYILFIIICLLGARTVLNTNAELSFGAQKQIVQETMKVVGNNPFELEEQGGCRQYAGWRYLFRAYGQAPVKSSIDPVFGWLYPDEISNVPPKYKVVILEKRSDLHFDIPNSQKIMAGGFEAFVVELK